MKLLVFIGVFVAGTASAEMAIDNLPFPSYQELIARELCDSRGGEGTYDQFKKAKEHLQTSVRDIFNVTEKTGYMDEILHKYCRKRPELKVCGSEFVDAIKPCLEECETDTLNLIVNIMEQFGEFACYRDGDRIATFLAGGGIQCLKDHNDGIQKCSSRKFTVDTSKLSTDASSISSLLSNIERCKLQSDEHSVLVLTMQDGNAPIFLNSVIIQLRTVLCGKWNPHNATIRPNEAQNIQSNLERLQTCVVEELQKCQGNTADNFIDALFKIVKKQACEDST